MVMNDRVIIIDRAIITNKTVTTEKVVTTENLKYYMRPYLSSNSVPQTEACISFMFRLDKLSRNNRGSKGLVNISAT